MLNFQFWPNTARNSLAALNYIERGRFPKNLLFFFFLNSIQMYWIQELEQIKVYEIPNDFFLAHTGTYYIHTKQNVYST